MISMRLNLEQEKYLNMLNRLDAFSLIKLEKQIQIQKGLFDVKDDFKSTIKCDNQLELINTVLHIRALNN